ncbi:pentapeptide repeat-containing protein [Maridesulfovibrio sp.]|uniref:pentapeptide repeat-containing protein n=1 Tax=Maridesulfovibrio sp. TaxID=2795000 RepID=UPI0029CA29D5|nr:pentapeptide repeat-containing protein [Maridesulfovibrio sp.]
MLVPSLSESCVTLDEFKPKSDLTYKKMTGLKLHNINVTQSLLAGSLFRETVVSSSTFHRCDFEGTRIENCKFKSTSFELADIRSCDFSNTVFKECIFDSAFIKNCNFTECIFETCSFKKSAFTESSAKLCKFNKMDLTGSTTMLNEYVNCEFITTSLGNCTFLLHICLNCSFLNVSFNLDSIGLIYGINEQNIIDNDFVFLGNEEGVNDKHELASSIINEYERRRWVLQAGIARLNFGIMSPMEFTEYLCLYIELSIKNNIIVKKEDMLFIGNIFNLLLRLESLPYLGVQSLLKFSHRYFSSSDSIGSQNMEALQTLANNLMLNIVSMQDNLANNLSSVGNVELECEAEFIMSFQRELEFDLCNLLDNVAYIVSGFKTKSRIVNTKEGSFIYYIYTTVAAVFGFQLILWMLNGCLIQLTEVYARVKALNDGPPKEYQEIAQSSKHPIPPEIQQALEIFLKHALDSDFSSDSLHKGLDISNFISVDVKKS